MANKANRPSPTDSATWYEPGTTKRGNDGNMYIVYKVNSGTQRWVPAYNFHTEHLVMSPKHPHYNTHIPIITTTATHKFNIGDRVKVIKAGSGCGINDMDKEVIITELGRYIHNNDGYKVAPAIGNTLDGNYGGYIGEDSFLLIKQNSQTLSSNTINKPFNFKNLKQVSKTKITTKKATQEVRKIETSLINKEEVFKMLALAESTGLPLLLVGNPGVAKTKAIIEYAKAWLNKDGKMNPQDFAEKLYVLETDEGTKASEIKGMPDLQTLFVNNQYKLNTPIADAEIVIINEVDKASAAIRNAMLGVMNEKFLFTGKEKIPCKWKLFVATCNEIPKDEVKSPFWDRFMLKMTVDRVSSGEMAKYYEKGARNYKESFTINIPNKQEIESVEISSKKLEKYLEVGYTQSSDRTLTFLPTVAKAVSFIWDYSIDKALVRTASIMIGQNAGSELQNKLISPEIKAIMSKVEMLNSYSTNEQLELAVAEIESLINTYTSRGILDQGQVEEIEHSMSYIIENHPARVDYKDVADLEDAVEM